MPVSEVSASASTPRGRKCCFFHTLVEGMRIWKIVGNAAGMNFDDAREQARAIVFLFRWWSSDGPLVPTDHIGSVTWPAASACPLNHSLESTTGNDRKATPTVESWPET